VNFEIARGLYVVLMFDSITKTSFKAGHAVVEARASFMSLQTSCNPKASESEINESEMEEKGGKGGKEKVKKRRKKGPGQIRTADLLFTRQAL
jgi:hypothetical protein